MNEPTAAAERRLLLLPEALRQVGLSIDPGRVATFLAAVRLCRLDGLCDLARIGRVTLVGSVDDIPTYDQVFDSVFGSAVFAGKVADPEEDKAPRESPPRGAPGFLPLFDGAATGHSASDDRIRNRKSFGRASQDERRALARLARSLDGMPTILRRASVPAAAGPSIDLARTARAARRTFGETLRLMRSARPRRTRRLLLLVDVSGSMKAYSELALRFAHLAARRLPRVETFCFGTELSRVTARLGHREAEEALERLSERVFDFDGGTMIGSALAALLANSRHAALVRGAVIIVFSDGLERGDPAVMIAAVERLSRLGHRLIWATPLAADPRYRPATRAMAAILPSLDALADGSSMAALARLVAGLDAVERMGRGKAAQRPRTAP